MPEHILRILIGELSTIRIVCKGTAADGKPCGMTQEVTLDRLESMFKGLPPKCHVCGADLGPTDKNGVAENVYTPLAKALTDLRAIEKRVGVEFIVPVKAPPAAPPVT